ncbi:MAG TPA: PadR family transcriptional regulator [Thermoanaerobaculia bacterium]|nr:PadR family transcriptional regulator [Thermoanaerobaculia bacterium]
MSLPHVLLGLLSEKPSTGYDLARTIESDLGPLWRAEVSQIYPTLARLRRGGLVHLRVLGPHRGPRRNLFRITAAGRRELRRWLGEPAPPPRERDEGLVRMAFLDALTLEERRRTILQYDRALAEEARRLRSRPPLPRFRREARRVVVERLEAMRRSLRLLLASAGTPSSAWTTGSAEKKK